MLQINLGAAKPKFVGPHAEILIKNPPDNIQMGVNITELLPHKELNFKDLNGKTIAVDAPLFLYQFLSSIRQPDGTPLMDSHGNITSHLSGLFSRTLRLMNYGMKLIYVFDGIPPDLKTKERERRRKLKEEAESKYIIAKAQGNLQDMKKFGSRISRLTPEMISESKELLRALGIPVVEAPSEGEAQAAHIVKNGEAYALASQDSDTLMFGTPLLIRNLSLIGRKKKSNALAYTSYKPELISLTQVLNSIGIDQNQLIALCMLIGTDYNIGGIKGIGPKNGVKLVHKHKENLDSLFNEVKWTDHFDIPWTEVFYAIKKIKVTDEYSLSWNPIDIEKIKDILVVKHEFSWERIESSLMKMIEDTKKKEQKGLGDFF